ncbi:MAG TPA: hypothetical protein VE687_05200 [Stellaceae bacterium]|nr:hypothetical protein [Stellaceae bacterium]
MFPELWSGRFVHRRATAAAVAPVARCTASGLTGGGNGTHQVYISGLTHHRLKDADIVDHLVELVEKKAVQIEAANRSEEEFSLTTAQ